MLHYIVCCNQVAIELMPPEQHPRTVLFKFRTNTSALVLLLAEPLLVLQVDSTAITLMSSLHECHRSCIFNFHLRYDSVRVLSTCFLEHLRWNLLQDSAFRMHDLGHMIFERFELICALLSD